MRKPRLSMLRARFSPMTARPMSPISHVAVILVTSECLTQRREEEFFARESREGTRIKCHREYLFASIRVIRGFCFSASRLCVRPFLFRLWLLNWPRRSFGQEGVEFVE